MSKLVMVETLSQYRMRYVVRVEDDVDIEDALEVVVHNTGNFEFHEFSQKHLGESPIIDHYEITEDEYITMFDKDNDYLASWDNEKKKSFINVIVSNELEGIDDGA